MVNKITALKSGLPFIFSKGYGNYYGVNQQHEIEESLKTDNRIFEYIPGNTPLRLFFDLEKKNTSHETTFNETCNNKFYNIIGEAIYTIFKSSLLVHPAIVGKSVLFFESSSHCFEEETGNVMMTKYSRHLIVRCYHGGDEFYFPDMSSVRLIASSIKSPLIDMSVYSINGRLMRCINQSKPKQRRILINCTEGSSPLDHLILSPIVNTPRTQLTLITSKSDKTERNWLFIIGEEMIRRLCVSLGCQLINVQTVIKRNIDEVEIRYKGACLYKGGVHKSNNQYVVARPDKTYIHCYDFECQTKEQMWVTTNSIIGEDVNALMFKGDYTTCLKKYVQDVDPGITDLQTLESNIYHCDATDQLISPLKLKLTSIPSDYRHVLSPISHRLLLRSNPTQSVTVAPSVQIVQTLVPQMNIHTTNIIKIGTVNQGVALDTRQKKKIIKECCNIVTGIEKYSQEEINVITQYLNARTSDNVVKLWAAFNKIIYVYSDGIYITKTLDYDMDSNDLSNISLSSDTLNLLFQIFPDPIVRQYVLNVLSAALFPRTPPRHVYFCYGTGSNGKSLFFSLLSKTFQYLFTTVTSKFLSTNNETPNAPSPVLLSIKNKRLVVNPETNESPYSSATLKRLCGGDQMNARTLYCSQIQSFVVMSRIFLSGNELPKFDTYDIAVTDRLVVIPFERRFIRNPSHKNERNIDPQLYHRVQTEIHYPKGLMRLLLNNLSVSNPHEEILTIPERLLTLQPEQQQVEPNMLHMWFRTNLEYMAEPGHILRVSDLYTNYCSAHNNPMSRNKLTKALSNYVALYKNEYPNTTYDTH
ncbi:hypothetical protein HZS_5122, partial [Henneguya salminicola]